MAHARRTTMDACARQVRKLCLVHFFRMMLPLRLPLTRSPENSTYTCAFCSFRSNDGIEYVKHLFQVHAFESNFRYVCGISSCTHVFTTGASFDAFGGHCTRKHHNWQHCFIPTIGVEEVGSENDGLGPGIDDLGADIDGCTPSRSDTSARGIATCAFSDDCSNTDQDMDDMPHSVDNPNEYEPECISPDNVKIAAAKFILTLKEKFKLTQASLDYTIKAVEEMMLLSANVHRQSFVENRELAFIPFHQHSSLANPFVGLKTEYQQTKFFKENFGLIVSDYTRLLSYYCVVVTRNQ